MFAKQTLVSASLIATLCVAMGEARPDSGRFELGAGFSTDENFIASAAIVQDDLFRTGAHLSMSARISALRQSFGIRFAKGPLDAQLYDDTRQLRPGLTRRATGATLTLSHQLTDRIHGYIGWRVEHVDGVGTISALREGVEYSTVDAFATQGTRIGLALEIADRRLGSDLDLSRVKVYAERHESLGPFVLHVGGSMTTLVSPSRIPLTERLYLEPGIVRGYAPAEIGPLCGGTFQLTGRAELELPVSRRYGISLAGFVDGAAIGARGIAGVGSSAGFGIRWRSPIGTLRFDWAFPIDGRGPQFVFGL